MGKWIGLGTHKLLTLIILRVHWYYYIKSTHNKDSYPTDPILDLSGQRFTALRATASEFSVLDSP